jgi:hypothetical protein
MRLVSVSVFASVAALAVFAAGCSIGATAELPRPAAHAPVAPNVVAIPMVGGEILGFGPGELVTRASLVSMDAKATCFDLIARIPRGLAAGDEIERHPWHVTVEVDGRESAHFDLPLRRCDGGACLPAGSALDPLAIAGDPNVVPLGERFCVEHLPVARREIALVEHEKLGTATFRFHFVDGLATASR